MKSIWNSSKKGFYWSPGVVYTRSEWERTAKTGTVLNGKKNWSSSRSKIIEMLSVFSQSISNLKRKKKPSLTKPMGMLIINKNNKQATFQPMEELGMAKVIIIVIFFNSSWNDILVWFLISYCIIVMSLWSLKAI